jgi:hypothetical protein
VETSIGNTDFVVMDCPGFDDTTRSDAEILKEITEQLSAIRLIGHSLKGIVYLHRITDNRMQGTAIRNLDLFKKIIGEDALSNIVFATTMWGNVTNISEASGRDSELREVYWGDMMAKGSSATRFEGTTASAQGIVSMLLGKRPVVLKVQEQLVDYKMSLNETAAGAFLEPTIQDEKEQYQKLLKLLESELQFERNNNRRLITQRAIKRNSKGLAKRTEDQKTLKSKPGEEVESKLDKWKKAGLSIGMHSLRVLAAACSISFAIAGFVTGGGL